MDKRSLIVTILTVLFVHFLFASLVLLPSCSTSSVSAETNVAAEQTPPLPQEPEKEISERATKPSPAILPTPEKLTQETLPAVKKKPAKRYPKAQRPAGLSTARAVNGKILDLKNWSKKNPRNYNRVCGILIDLNSRKVLWQLNPDKQVPIASLTKIMALMVTYETLQRPDCLLDLDTEIEITPEARKVPPSGVAFRPEEKSFPLEKLMIAAAVKSANDATYLIAQALGNGSADKFVEAMNARARELGMTQTRYYNPHGLPGRYEGKPDNVSTARDLSKLCEAYLTYPQLHEWSSARAATFRTKNDLLSHNNLLKKGQFYTPGVSGIKTGYTINAGLCLAAVCDRDGRRLLGIVTGFNSSADRDRFMKNLLDWGFRQK